MNPKRPWLDEYTTLLQELGADPWQADIGDWFERCNQRLHARRSAVRLVDYPLEVKLSAIEYERRIIEEGTIASRGDLHDAVNALTWLRFPDAKRTVSQLHLAEALVARDQGRRGKKRDALTLFDEHGLVFLTRDAHLVDGLRQHAWRTYLFEYALELKMNTRLVVFGHALLARLATPHKGLTAHAMPLLWSNPKWPNEEQWDALIAAGIGALNEPSDLFALPVMGLPGWSAHQDAAFYEDRKVFRPLRAEQLT